MLVARIAGAETVLSQLTSITPQVKGRVKNCVQRLTLQLLRKVKEDKLSGQVLKNQTGTLRRSINQKVEDLGSAIVGSVGTNLVYARVHEFGFDGQVNVKEHLRTITKAWGRQLAAPVQFTVHAHTAQRHLPERSFLRSAMDEMRPEIREQLVQSFRGLLW